MLLVQLDLNFNEKDSYFLNSIVFLSLISSYNEVGFDSSGISPFLELKLGLITLLVALLVNLLTLLVNLLTPLELLSLRVLRDGIVFCTAEIPSSSDYNSSSAELGLLDKLY